MEHSELLLSNPLTFSSHGRFLLKHGLHSAALYYKNRNETPERRAARASRYAMENSPLPAYVDGQCLGLSFCRSIYNYGAQDDPHGYGIRFNTDGNCGFNESAFRTLHDKCENSVEH